MESALYGMYALVVFVSEILLQWKLQWNIDTTKGQWISKTCSLY